MRPPAAMNSRFSYTVGTAWRAGRAAGCFLPGGEDRSPPATGPPQGNRDRGHLVVNQISRQSGKPLVLIPGEAIFDSYVLTLDKACVFETLTERDQQLWSVAGRH